MKFPRQQSPPPYLNRRDQYRMLGLCVLLLMVLLLIDAARQPQNWAWFFNLSEPSEPAVQEDLKEIDFRALEQPAENLAPDEFVAVGTEPAGTDPFTDAPAQTNGVSQFDRQRLAAVQDQRVGFLRAERPALQAVIDHLEQVPWEVLKREGARDVGFRVINVEPQRYRGRLITIEGSLRRYEPFDLPLAEDEGPGEGGSLYQGWMFTADSGNNPWFILCTEPTPGLPQGDQIEARVRVSGYFFKRYGYPTATSLHVAPMLIARRFEVLPSPAADQERTGDLTRYVIGILGIMGTLFGVMVWRFHRSDRKFARSHLAEIAESRLDARPEDLAGLKDLNLSDAGKLQLPDPVDEKDLPELK